MLPLQQEFDRRGPWVTQFHIDGEAYGGTYTAHSEYRLKDFQNRIPRPGRVLELGCLEGGHSFALAKRATEVVAIDSRADNLTRARWIQSLVKTSNIRFEQVNLEEDSLDQLGTFDWTFNVGLLYHLPRPWELLAQLSEITSRMYLWTHVIHEPQVTHTRGGYRGTLYSEYGLQDRLSGMSQQSFWPTFGELVRMLQDNGFPLVETVLEQEAHHPGPAVSVMCVSKRALPFAQVPVVGSLSRFSARGARWVSRRFQELSVSG